MKKFSYETKYFHKDLFNNDDCVIDNVISNDISADWDYKKGIPVVVGFLHKDKILVFLSESPDDTEFPKAVQQYIKEVLCDTPIWAFNRHMEIGNFKGQWDFDVEINEIKPFSGQGWTTDRFYNELIARKTIADCQVADVFGGDMRESIRHYDKYQDTGKIEYALRIVEHCINGLLKQSVIQKHKKYFLANFNVNKRGWVE